MSERSERGSSAVIRIFSIDDNPVFRAAIRRFFARHDGFLLLDSAQDERTALNAPGQPAPDVVLLDLQLAGHMRLDLIPVIRRKWPATKIIILTFDDRPAYRSASLRGGADGFVSKLSLATDLIPAILQVIQAGSSGGTRADPAED